MPYARSILALVLLSSAGGCDLGQYGAGGGRYHPEGFAAAEVHGLELKQQAQDCRTCHGDELLGASAPSCDGCHTPADPPAWRSDGDPIEQLRTIGDFIAGMTDRYAIARHQELVGPVELPDRF